MNLKIFFNCLYTYAKKYNIMSLTDFDKFIINNLLKQ